VPLDYAFLTVKAASSARVSADEFFKSLNVSFDNPAAKCLHELIEKMDCLLLKEESKGVRDPEVALLAAEVADICLLRNEPEEAEIMLRRAHAIFALESGSYQLEMANVCLKIARLLIQKQKYPEAELLLMQSMEIKNRFLGDKHIELADVLLELGYLYFCQGNYGPASGFVRAAWSILEGNCSPEKTRYVLELLIKCFEQMGMDNECFIYREQLN
ncbi:MAG: tetratricopeptide repeat protein, partial [Candidatus Obscuribacterales bacterium]|nr:tetratricopeptide repeat protein [Candidatus Obscuribacterales bacterium]